MPKKRLNITMDHPYLSGMELLIKDGLYESQSEIIKDALRRLFQHYEIELISEESEVKEVMSITL
jgi:Arc/MetJ-type ribon-helix-helix transcriptional regulator